MFVSHLRKPKICYKACDIPKPITIQTLFIYPAMDGWRRCIVVESPRLGSCKTEEKSWDSLVPLTAAEHLHNGLISALHFFMHLIWRHRRGSPRTFLPPRPSCNPIPCLRGNKSELFPHIPMPILSYRFCQVFAENKKQRCSAFRREPFQFTLTMVTSLLQKKTL